MSSIWFWIIFGLSLIFLEFVIPGLVVVFLGAGALITAFVQWTGLIETWSAAATTWLVGSFSTLILLRGVFRKYLPGEMTRNYIEEDDEAFGAIVEVAETVNSDNENGRIKYRGTTWSARCIEGEIPAGQKAKIILRNDLSWVVDHCEQELLTDMEI